MPRGLLLFFTLLVGSLSAQSAFRFTANPKAATEVVGTYAALSLDQPLFRTQLAAKRQTLELPLPDGTFGTFTVENSPVFAPELAARYPRIGSYRVDGPWGAGRIAISHKGVDALLRGPEGTYAIQPGETADKHLVFYTREYAGEEFNLPLNCGYDPADPLSAPGTGRSSAKLSGKRAGAPRELRQYDLALTNTGEFAQQVGGTKEDVLAAFNTAVSTINAIFEREVGVRMNLLPLSEQLIYLNPDTDPFVDTDEGTGLLDQVINAFQDNNIPATAYDLGHIFTSSCVDVGGVVSGLACSGSKTRGVTCLQGKNIARTAERVMAHEIAHQFTVSHSWNNCPSSQAQRAGNTAFEPGSGTTIMSYAGACGDQNVGSPDPYYHVASLEQFITYTREGGAAGCATVIETDNVSPEVILDYEDGFYIPKGTPFRLTGTATDANDPQEQLTYNWEEYDLGPAVDITDPKGSAPLFRSVAPAADGFTRYFPRVDRVANGISASDEVLPDYARPLTFRLTARDNNPVVGGVDWATVRFQVADVGAFTVNEPDLADDGAWRVGEYREVTWNVAGTDAAPVKASSVDILLSGDGGLTFDQVLVANVANTGSAFVTVPDTLGTAMRVIVAAADNVFYNMNAQDFSIAPAEEATYILDYSLHYANVCLPETVTSTFTVGSVLDFTGPVLLEVADGSLPEGVVATFAETQLIPGQSTTLTIDLSGFNSTGRLTIPVSVTSPGRESSRREIVLDVVANDFSDLQLGQPAEGTEGIGLTADFKWTAAANAETYEIQIAPTPAFAAGTLFASAQDLTRTTFTPEEFFSPNQVYFWRVRPVNSCGAGPWTETASFHTVSSQCDTYTGTDTPVALPGSGGAFTRESKLFVDRRGTINDLNLPNVHINYQFASKVTVSLTSPAGTTVTLYAEKCFSTNSINLGFDDDAPEAVACPPDDKRVFQPLDALAAFAGEDTFGDWVLSVAVSETNGAAGQIVAWSVEFCADVSAPTPETLVNTPTEVQPLGRNAVLRAELEIVTDADAPAATLYQLTRLPARGHLEIGGTVLRLGDTFTQADINDGRLVYENRDSSLATDQFGFVVTTESGGYLPVTYHDLLLTEDAVNPTRETAPLDASLAVYPNPTRGALHLRWSAPGNRDMSLDLYDLSGRRLLRRWVPLATGAATLDTDDLLPGVYLLVVDGTVYRRIMRQ
ncbi:reprolysin-like metallopeptidase [Neolewinella litorea]|uniref:T9SS type A sorting domain-containing protein n=1 Tax=Neolewinella litorea TaxID=2562452 RepID=A0A4S4NKI6_9BACT|nr:zinc-dependent metalloprotease family protein [Neolewinella litorea]THH39465.1 T9SS type A sorting domain-containing protein [Neolewinella litorea]